MDYRYVSARLDRRGAIAEITIRGPETDAPDLAGIHQQAAEFGRWR